MEIGEGPCTCPAIQVKSNTPTADDASTSDGHKRDDCRRPYRRGGESRRSENGYSAFDPVTFVPLDLDAAPLRH